jgi:hypothetical protein
LGVKQDQADFLRRSIGMSASVAAERASRARFSLKALFLVMTAIAVILVPAYWFGAGYLFSIGGSVALVGYCALAYRGGSKSGAVVVAIVGAVVGFVLAIFSMVFFAHSFFNLIACAVLIAVGVRPRSLGVALVAVLLVVYGFAIYQGAAELVEVRALKAKYAFESLEPRLAFEKRTSPNAQVLHEETYRAFAFSPGFGVARMPRFRPGMVEIDPPAKFVLPAAVDATSAIATQAELYGAHRTAVSDFLEPDRIGYVRSRTEVAGFNAHGFTTLHEQWSNGSRSNAKWQVVRLELVSLLRQAEPRVYVAATMPAMDRLANVPHRALNDFEKGALPQLVSQKDVVIKQEFEHIEMLGAVRAGTTCLECHEAARGKLLGAFSYEITPVVNRSQARLEPKLRAIRGGE